MLDPLPPVEVKYQIKLLPVAVNWLALFPTQYLTGLTTFGNGNVVGIGLTVKTVGIEIHPVLISLTVTE